MKSNAKMKVTGHVVIRDLETKEILVDKHNDIHMENFSEAVALSLANYDRGVIEEMHFGNGGTVVSTTGEITYYDPHIVGQNADLYNPTYYKVVNDRSSNFASDSTTTNVKTNHTATTTYTDIIITCTLGYGEPSDQSVYDNATSLNDKYVFDELGLKAVDNDTGVKRLLTHVIFHPVQKALNRAIEVIYTVRITML
jgi:hypothetical protein